MSKSLFTRGLPFPDEPRWGRRRKGRTRPPGPPGGPDGRRSWPRRLALLLAAAVVLPLAGLAVLWLTLPDPLPLAEGGLEGTAYMELRREQAREAGRELVVLREAVPLDRVPDHVQRAVRVAEDAMFYRHGGVDWHEVRASVREWWSDEERLRGASTITMQLARNLYLSPERSLLRKAREVLLAIRLEDRLPKDRILELYLNVVELGPGVFGVEAAARHYWGVSISELDRQQAAELAATLPSPLEDNPRTRTRRFLWRADLIHRRAFAADTTEAPPLEADTAGPDTVPDIPPPVDTVGTDTVHRPLPAPDTAGPHPPDTVGDASADDGEGPVSGRR